ncbi:hypothetical protein G6F62_014786 [Rhizopus arrhizus]|nr:hypothetical protein G6F62_014786 [Rhizopus arrhizus]
MSQKAQKESNAFCANGFAGHCISSPEPPMDFSSSISSSLPDLEKSQLTNLLSEFGDCFKSKPTTVTPRTRHHIDTGDHKPLSQPPHRASAAENDVTSKLIDEMLQQGIVQPRAKESSTVYWRLQNKVT